MKYRKLPVVIDAVQIELEWFSIPDTAYAALDSLGLVWNRGLVTLHRNSVTIHTLEGIMEARVGDYIIRGVQGELYPCKREIFEMTYEAVKDE